MSPSVHFVGAERSCYAELSGVEVNASRTTGIGCLSLPVSWQAQGSPKSCFSLFFGGSLRWCFCRDEVGLQSTNPCAFSSVGTVSGYRSCTKRCDPCEARVTETHFHFRGDLIAWVD